MNAPVGARRSLAVSICLVIACSDSTAPKEGAFQVIVNPASLPKAGPSAGVASLTLRNTSRVAVEIDWCNISLEAEASPGVWPDPAPAEVRCLPIELAAQSEQTSSRSVGLDPRRRRLVYGYWFAGSSTDQTTRLTAYSNAFVVEP